MQTKQNDMRAISDELISKRVALANRTSNLAVLDEAWLEDVNGGIIFIPDITVLTKLRMLAKTNLPSWN